MFMEIIDDNLDKRPEMSDLVKIGKKLNLNLTQFST